MNKSTITPISENLRQESYVYRNPINGTAQKLYWRVSADYLRIYAQIQNSVGEVIIDSDDGSSVPFGGDFINKVVVKILSLPEESSDACSIIPGEKYGSKCVIFEPEFVGGISLWEFASENQDDEGFMYLLEYIELCVETTFRNMSIFGAEFIQENAKITKIENGELEITVTDIAGNTPHMVRLTDDKLYFYRYLILSIMYSNLLKLKEFITGIFKKAQH